MVDAAANQEQVHLRAGGHRRQPAQWNEHQPAIGERRRAHDIAPLNELTRGKVVSGTHRYET
jgi:hypothetical protein